MTEYTDKEARDAALAVTLDEVAGRKIVDDALEAATSQMVTLTGNMKTKGGKIEALKHHALHMGIATRLIERGVPLHEKMYDDLKRIAGENEAGILGQVWFSKVLIEVQKGIEKHGEAEE